MVNKIWITNHSGKLHDFQSIGTTCRNNPNCEKYAKVKGSICERCYAQRYTEMRKALEEHLEANAEILTKGIIPFEDLPVINACYFRFESFGDLHNTTQLINYFNICKKNPDVNFALWTKNPQIVKEVADQKPKNLQILLSSLMLNTPVDISNMPYIDKVFTVYDKKTIEEKKININCGAKSCLTCHKCYKKGNKVINEKLK